MIFRRDQVAATGAVLDTAGSDHPHGVSVCTLCCLFGPDRAPGFVTMIDFA
jgi:hypothetical protein